MYFSATLTRNIVIATYLHVRISTYCMLHFVYEYLNRLAHHTNLEKHTSTQHTTRWQRFTPKLAGAKLFSKPDARNGYWNVILDEESSYLTTFSWSFSRYSAPIHWPDHGHMTFNNEMFFFVWFEMFTAKYHERATLRKL